MRGWRVNCGSGVPCWSSRAQRARGSPEQSAQRPCRRFETPRRKRMSGVRSPIARNRVGGALRSVVGVVASHVPVLAIERLAHEADHQAHKEAHDEGGHDEADHDQNDASLATIMTARSRRRGPPSNLRRADGRGAGSFPGAPCRWTGLPDSQPGTESCHLGNVGALPHNHLTTRILVGLSTVATRRPYETEG